MKPKRRVKDPYNIRVHLFGDRFELEVSHAEGQVTILEFNESWWIGCLAGKLWEALRIQEANLKRNRDALEGKL